MAYLDITERSQGNDKRGRSFGYCGIIDKGGQFFTWMPTLRETLDSIEDDEMSPPENWPERAYQEVRGFIRRSWAEKNSH